MTMTYLLIYNLLQRCTCSSPSSLTLLRCDIIAWHFWQLTGSPVCMLLGFFNWSNLIATTFVSARRHFLPACDEASSASVGIWSATLLDVTPVKPNNFCWQKNTKLHFRHTPKHLYQTHKHTNTYMPFNGHFLGKSGYSVVFWKVYV